MARHFLTGGELGADEQLRLLQRAIELKAARIDYEFKKGKYKRVEREPQTCALVAAKDPVPCTFQTKFGRSYEVVATIVDAKGRANQTKLTFWVTGGDQPPSRDLAQERVQLIPDKKDYAGGDTAELLETVAGTNPALGTLVDLLNGPTAAEICPDPGAPTP